VATPFTHVQPGDLIRASDWNAVLDELSLLEERVAALEVGSPPSTSGPHVTGRSPAGDFIDPGRLTLFGSGFDVPSSGNVVLLDGVAATSSFVFGSDDTTLIFDLPTLPSLPRHVQVSVKNKAGEQSNAIDVFMKPPSVGITGTADVAKVTQNLPTVSIGNPTTFYFLLSSVTSAPVEFAFSPSYANANGSDVTSWANASTIVDENGNPIPNAALTIPSGQPTTIGVKVTPPAGATSVQLGLHAAPNNSADARLTQTSPLITVTIGQPYKDNPSAPTLVVIGDGAAVKKTTIDGLDVWQVGHGLTNVSVKLDLTWAASGNYTITANIGNDPAGVWSFHKPAQPVSPASVPAALNGALQHLSMIVDNTASTAISQISTASVVVSKTNTDGDGGPFTSTFSFPIGIF
jgi:hypothetical protein